MALGTGTITRGDAAAFAACLVLSLTALALPAALREPVAGSIRSTILRPLLVVEARTLTSAGYRRSMDALRAERDSLALTAALQPALRDENARLRGLLGLAGRIRTGYVPAEVLHQAGVADVLTLVLSAGRAEGVEVLAPVITTNGLVGLVRSVDAHTALALAWTHPDFRASAMVAGGGVFGVVAARRGERATEMMELHGVAYRQQLRPGEIVVTSGLGGVFPRGIPIGTVQGVLSESAEWERTYLLEPAVHPAEATHVLVLARAHAADTLTAAFRDTLPPAADTATRRAGPVRR
jgi:rod shape-determining protein MreC